MTEQENVDEICTILGRMAEQAAQDHAKYGDNLTPFLRSLTVEQRTAHLREMLLGWPELLSDYLEQQP